MKRAVIIFALIALTITAATAVGIVFGWLFPGPPPPPQPAASLPSAPGDVVAASGLIAWPPSRSVRWPIIATVLRYRNLWTPALSTGDGKNKPCWALS